MAALLGFLILCVSISTVVLPAAADESQLPPCCDYPAIYNFGDSNSDTGGIAAAFYPPAYPSGETYFRRTAGRASDGRLIIDFIAEHLGLPYLSAYLDSIGSSYRHGANFATGGSTVVPAKESWFESGVSPFPLQIQVAQYRQFNERTAYYVEQVKKKCLKKRLAKPKDLAKALFTVDIGQNDIAAVIRRPTFQLQLAAVPELVGKLVDQLRDLYGQGARTFWIHNTGPIGCLPITVSKVKDPPAGYLDKYGCVKGQNDIAIRFNQVLKDEVKKLRTQLYEASMIYVDVYAAKHELITNAKNQGFEDAFNICCGYHGIGYDVWCGNRGSVNGSDVFAGSCDDPSAVISWDGVHYTEAANRWIANRLINGSLSDPPVSIAAACRKQFM